MKFVGWDWASTSHDVTVLDEQGRVERWALRHTKQALAEALARLARHGQPAHLPVIIERSTGLVVERLLAAGHPVVRCTPPPSTPPGPAGGAAGAKSDPGDSYKLADYLRTDGHRLRRLQPLDPGLREDHVRARTAASNQLGALLDAHWPGPKAIFCKLASDVALAFLADYPTPQSAARLGQVRLAAFCRRHAYRGGKSPAELLARLRAAPVPSTGLAPAVLAQLVTAQVQQLLRSLQATIGELEAAIKQRVAQHPRAELLRALPGVGTINLAQLLAEVGPILDRVSTAEQGRRRMRRSAGHQGLGARPAGSTSGGLPTPGLAPPSPPSPTTLACSHRGPAGCTPTLAPAANAIRTPPASSPAPGCGSSGPAGTPARLTIPAPTSPNSASRSPDLTQGTTAATTPRP
jgi:Transposase